MRLGVVWDANTSAIVYRAILPLKAMERRGHDVVWPIGHGGPIDEDALASCDVVHVYRRLDSDSQTALRSLRRRGVALTWDNDDDFAAVPEESPVYRETGGSRGARLFKDSVRMAQAARVVTVPSEHLAGRYRESGVDHVRVIPNLLDVATRPRQRHDGLVIGWIAGLEHRADAARIGIAPALERILDAHPDVRVVCVGVDLDLSQRYEHQRLVPFHELPEQMARFDIGIAPLSDIPFNHARSDVKVREYAASGVPWVASRATPYAALGEQQGGILVDDDQWFETLDRLIREPEERRRLVANGRSWAKTQTIHLAAGQWEDVFQTAAAAGAAAA